LFTNAHDSKTDEEKIQGEKLSFKLNVLKKGGDQLHCRQNNPLPSQLSTQNHFYTMATTTHLRKESLSRRDALPAPERNKKSTLIYEQLITLDCLIRAATICSYVNFRSEVDTTPILDWVLGSGKNLVVPVTRVATKTLELAAITNPGAELTSGYCGIPEPTPEIAERNRVAPHVLEVVIIPGSVFDRRGGRLGYGGGYYDRLLAAIPEAARIGLAFSMQVLEKLQLQPHDQLLDYVVTEDEIIAGGRGHTENR
jgi:5-formyltetrahydrofolate cyclo-ligase